MLAEDGVGASHVLSSVPGGPTYAIARNQLNDSEFTGPTFSDDGRTLFVNIHDAGHHPGDHRSLGDVPVVRRGEAAHPMTIIGRTASAAASVALVRQARTVLRRCIGHRRSAAR